VARLKKTNGVVTPEISVADRIKSLDVEDILGLSMNEVKEEADKSITIQHLQSPNSKSLNKKNNTRMRMKNDKHKSEASLQLKS